MTKLPCTINEKSKHIKHLYIIIYSYFFNCYTQSNNARVHIVQIEQASMYYIFLYLSIVPLLS
jgi:hypothetical protein